VCKHLLSLLLLALLPFSLCASELKDPTRPAGIKTAYSSSSSPAVQSWKLTSTLISINRRNAIINGRLVSVGQFIHNAKVLVILPNEVELLHNKKRIRIKLLAQNIKDFSISADK